MEGLGAAAVRDDKVAAVLGVDVGALQRYRPSAKSVAFSVFSQSLSTGLPAYSDSAGKLKKCKWGASYCITASKHVYSMEGQSGI